MAIAADSLPEAGVSVSFEVPQPIVDIVEREESKRVCENSGVASLRASLYLMLILRQHTLCAGTGNGVKRGFRAFRACSFSVVFKETSWRFFKFFA